MNTTLKIYDKIRALAGDWEMYHNGIKWNTVFRNGEIIRGRIEHTTYANDYFTVESLEDDNTFRFFKQGGITGTYSYSTDNGITWTSSSDTTSWTINKGDKILFKSNMSSLANRDGHHCIVATKTWKVYGNIMSLIYGDDYIGKQSFPNNSSRNFKYLFFKNGEGLSKLVDASGLVLPATTLTEQCYYGMFNSCPNLQNAPKLPATTLAYACYSDMFSGCTSLVSAPSLPATTLAVICYYYMFEGCTSLVTAPVLPATTLATGCYYSMFEGCTSLVNAPELPATNLTVSCYQEMFRGCTSLVTAPVLPATTLASGCYLAMFYECSSLKSITCYATDRSASTCLSIWVYGVSATGDFYKTDTSWTDTGTSSIPAGWTQHNIQNLSL